MDKGFELEWNFVPNEVMAGTIRECEIKVGPPLPRDHDDILWLNTSYTVPHTIRQEAPLPCTSIRLLSPHLENLSKSFSILQQLKTFS